jgi:hypothetical protein
MRAAVSCIAIAASSRQISFIRPHRMMLHSCDVGVVDKEEEGPPCTTELDTIVIRAKSGGRVALSFPARPSLTDSLG